MLRCIFAKPSWPQAAATVPSSCPVPRGLTPELAIGLCCFTSARQVASFRSLWPQARSGLTLLRRLASASNRRLAHCGLVPRLCRVVGLGVELPPLSRPGRLKSSLHAAATSAMSQAGHFGRPCRPAPPLAWGRCGPVPSSRVLARPRHRVASASHPFKSRPHRRRRWPPRATTTCAAP